MSDVERPERFDTSDPDQREEGLASCALAVRRGELVLLPTDTVYGIGCDAFDPAAVKRLLDAKGRGREMPPPVLVSNLTTLDALATDVPEWARLLTDHFWPGSLTLVLHQQTSLQWDLGDARGTVALRMPDHDVTLDLIQRTGPLAVSSANVTGMPAALDATEAIGMLGDEVVAVLDSGSAPGGTASTIVDCTGHTPRVLREGAVPVERLREVLAAEGHWLEDDDDDQMARLPAPDEPDVIDGELLGDPFGDPDDDDPDPDPGPGQVEDEHGSHAADVVDAELVPDDSADDSSDSSSDGGKHRAADALTAPVDDIVPAAPAKAAAKKAPAGATAKKAPAKKAPPKKTPAKKAAKKAPAATKTVAKKAVAKKAVAKKAVAKKTVAKKTPAKKASAKRAPAKKPAVGSDGGADSGA